MFYHWTIFSGCKLYEVDFNDAILDNANFSFSFFRDNGFYRSELNRVIFVHIYSDMTRFKESRLYGADFTDAHFGFANSFGNCDLVNTKFRRTVMEVTFFKYCDMTNTDITSAILIEAVFSGSQMSNAILIDVCIEDAIIFHWTNLINASLTGIKGFDGNWMDKVLSVHNAVFPNETYGQKNPRLICSVRVRV